MWCPAPPACPSLQRQPQKQAANNVAGHLQRPENEVAGLLQLWQLAVVDMRGGRDPDWVGIRRRVLQTAPPYADYLDSLVNFVAEKAGGQGGEHLQDFLAFWRANINPVLRRCLPHQVWDALATCKHVLVALALLKAAYACPPADVKHGVCMWLRASEVQALSRATGRAAERVQEAERLLAEVRAATALTDLPKPVRDHKKLARAFYRFEGQLAQWVLNRFFEKGGEAMSLGSISQVLLDDIGAEYPKATLEPLARVLPKDEVQRGTEHTPLPASKVHQIVLVETSATGQVLGVRARLRARGLDLGSLVKSKAAEVGRIAGVDEQKGEVVLKLRLATRPEEGAAEKRCPIKDFLDAWVLADASAVREVHEAWPAKRFCVSEAAAPVMAKAFIVSGLSHLGDWLDQRCKPAGRLTLLVKPRRMAEALQDLPKHSLVLCPETTGVKAAADAGTELVEAVLEPALKKTRFFLQPATSPEAVSPFWFVQTTTDERKANMVWAKYLVSGYFGQDFVGHEPLQFAAQGPSLPSPEPPAPAKPRGLRLTAKGPARVAAPAKGGSSTGAPDEDEDLGPMRELCLTVPVLVNHVDIKAGEELLVFTPAPPKKERPGKPILVTQLSEHAAQAAKKARVA